MPYLVTPFRRRMVMAVLLALAMTGAVVRYLAPEPSALRDLGTLLLVLWLPAVGNFVAYLLGKLPRRQLPPAPDFPAGTAFSPQLQAQVQMLALQPGFIATLDPADRRGTVIIGRRGFTVRLAQPMAQWLAAAPPEPLALELLRPDQGLPALVPGTDFHLLAGNTAVGKGRVVAAAKPAV